MKVMERYIGRTGERTVFMIDCINGKAIKSHSFYKDENETILMPGTFLRVIEKWSPADGLHMIRLQEDTPPIMLVSPPFSKLSSSSPSVETFSVQNVPICNVQQPATSAVTPNISQPDNQGTSTQLITVVDKSTAASRKL